MPELSFIIIWCQRLSNDIKIGVFYHVGLRAAISCTLVVASLIFLLSHSNSISVIQMAISYPSHSVPRQA